MWMLYRDLGKYLGIFGLKFVDGDWGVWNCFEGGFIVFFCERFVKVSLYVILVMLVGFIFVVGIIFI